MGIRNEILFLESGNWNASMDSYRGIDESIVHLHDQY